MVPPVGVVFEETIQTSLAVTSTPSTAIAWRELDDVLAEFGCGAELRLEGIGRDGSRWGARGWRLCGFIGAVAAGGEGEDGKRQGGEKGEPEVHGQHGG